MKKILTLVFISLLLFVSCEKKEIADSSSDVDGYLLYKESYTDSGSYTLYDYNKRAHVIKKTVYYQDGTTLETNYTYTYKKNGSYKVVVEDFDKSIEEYDAGGRLIKKTVDINSFPVSTVYRYDDEGRVVEYQAVAKEKKNLKAWHKNTYDDKGNLIRDDMFYANGSSAGYYKYSYDDKGNVIQTFKFMPDGKEDSVSDLFVWEYEYDDNDRVIRKARKNLTSGRIYPIYTYEYDEKGYLIKESDLFQNTIKEYKPASDLIK